jgi:hypothetical protein
MGYEKMDEVHDIVRRQEVLDVHLDERAAPRFTLLIRTAKLICGNADYLCVIRDVSAEGISVRLFHPIPTADEIILEMQTGDRHPVRAVWQNPGEAGFQFVTPVDVEQMIRRSSRFPKRELRFAAALPIKLVFRGVRHDAVLQNISQQGAMIVCADRLAIAQTLMIEGPNLPEIEAKVRWRKAEQYGFIFDTTFRLHELAEIVHAMQKCAQASSRSTGPSSGQPTG